MAEITTLDILALLTPWTCPQINTVTRHLIDCPPLTRQRNANATYTLPHATPARNANARA